MAEGRDEMTPSGRMKHPSIAQVCERVLKSWNDIKTEVVKSFKKCGISNDMDDSEDHLLYMSDSSDDSAYESLEVFHESSSDEFLGFEDE